MVTRKKAVKKKPAKKSANTKIPSKRKPANARTLTLEDREKIQRLLGTVELGKVRLAIELTEETCSVTELKDIFTDEIILSLVSSGDVELFAITASFFLRHNEHWPRFLQCANNTNVLTAVALKHKDTDLDDFIAITAEAAAMLSTGDRWDTNLDGLTQLSVEVAQNLAGAPSLSLRGIHSLPDDVAAALAEHKDELELGGLTELSDAAAESLGKHQGTSLDLDGLTELSDVASEGISLHRGKLSLGGLSGLSSAAAKSFGRFQGSELCLNSLTSLSESAAESIGKHERKGEISLQGLENLSDSAAIALDNKSLQLPSEITKQIAVIVKKIATAESLLTREQQTKVRKLIKTNDAENLAMACELLSVAAASQGDWIKLFPKTRIRELLNTWEPGIWNTLASAMKGFPRVAEQLKDQVANRVNTYPSQWEVRERIQTSRSDILINANDDVIELIDTASKYGLTIYAEHLSDAEAERLAKYKGHLEFRNLTELSDGPGHLALCESFSQKDSPISLSLTALSDAAAEILSKHEGYLSLGLTALSDAVAESFSKYKGSLELVELTELSDAAAESLSKQKGDLSFQELSKLSDTAARSLANKKPKLDRWNIELDNLPESAAKILRDAGHGG
jgi:hypothetical protein